jgi:geranylgeranyl diphosphate synthase, type II
MIGFYLLCRKTQMYSYKECLELVETKISELNYKSYPNELYVPIRYILSIGGKRLRPCLALMAHNLFSDNLTDIINPAIGIEIFHNFTLLHDDIMDNASMRRNQETVHLKWNNNTAILSGDAMMILAYELISNTSKELFIEIFNIFNKTALEVCEGQQLDMNFEKTNNVSETEYLEMIRLKTAVLLSASLAIGGITAKTSVKNVDKLYALGISIGLAFQLQDDYLDIYASSSKFGKTIGGDIISNKKTYLLISALNSGNKELINRLNQWISKSDFDPPEKIKAVSEIFNQLQIREKTQKQIDYYFHKGIENLEKLTVAENKKDLLFDIIFKTMKREY